MFLGQKFFNFLLVCVLLASKYILPNTLYVVLYSTSIENLISFDNAYADKLYEHVFIKVCNNTYMKLLIIIYFEYYVDFNCSGEIRPHNV